MASPNVGDIVATTLENRSGKLADNVTHNTALLSRLKAKGRVRPVSGGRLITEEFTFAENSNASWYSGYEILPTGASDQIDRSEFSFKQAACAIVMSGLEELQNSGQEAVIDLLESRIANGESTMTNLISTGVYSDGTGFGGKQITGLAAAVPVDPTTGTYGGINRANYPFWQSKVTDVNAAPSAATIQGQFNAMWASLVRGADRPDLIVVDSTVWAAYMASLQTLQRFAGSESATLGFPSVKFMDADVVLDGGMGGDAPAATSLFLNTKYLSYRPHKDRNMVPLAPQRRFATNQDATIQILAWAGNLTCSGAQFQGRIIHS